MPVRLLQSGGGKPVTGLIPIAVRLDPCRQVLAITVACVAPSEC